MIVVVNIYDQMANSRKRTGDWIRIRESVDDGTLVVPQVLFPELCYNNQYVCISISYFLSAI